jgi:hypothetical protein
MHWTFLRQVRRIYRQAVEPAQERGWAVQTGEVRGAGGLGDKRAGGVAGGGGEDKGSGSAARDGITWPALDRAYVSAKGVYTVVTGVGAIATAIIVFWVKSESSKLEDKMDEKFKGVDEKFKGVDEKFKGVDEKFKGVDEKFKGVEVRLDRLEAKLDRLLERRWW